MIQDLIGQLDYYKNNYQKELLKNQKLNKEIDQLNVIIAFNQDRIEDLVNKVKNLRDIINDIQHENNVLRNDNRIFEEKNIESIRIGLR